MDQEKKPQLPNEDDWFDELLSPPAVGEEPTRPGDPKDDFCSA